MLPNFCDADPDRQPPWNCPDDGEQQRNIGHHGATEVYLKDSV
ncbi:MAG: hypothetical protein VKK04_04940 [Synechococcales bacterium]|nr:hypothetical protein [Synechococcales bacterium]